MTQSIQAYAAFAKGEPLRRFTFEPQELGADEVVVAVEYCGICHSDLSMIDNEWGNTHYPIVPGHEIVGRIVEVGPSVKNLQLKQRVGVGWFSGSCLMCNPCLSGNQHLCPSIEQTIVSRHGGFATRVRCHSTWATPLPEELDATKAGPLFCGGITVFNPIVFCGVKPTDRVAVIGIGGLGHLALQFLNKWGCEVHAFSSTASKRDEILKLGAHHVINPKEKGLEKLRGQFDFILSTVNVPQDWPRLLDTLAPNGQLHVVGAVLEPLAIPAFSLIMGQKSVSGSPLGSPSVIRRMLEFCGRHKILPQTEEFPMSLVNEAIAHVRAGKARYRVVLKNDL